MIKKLELIFSKSDHPATQRFHRQVIRLVKGIIKAWEQWLDEIKEDKWQQP